MWRENNGASSKTGLGPIRLRMLLLVALGVVPLVIVVVIFVVAVVILSFCPRALGAARLGSSRRTRQRRGRRRTSRCRIHGVRRGQRGGSKTAPGQSCPDNVAGGCPRALGAATEGRCPRTLGAATGHPAKRGLGQHGHECCGRADRPFRPDSASPLRWRVTPGRAAPRRTCCGGRPRTRDAGRRRPPSWPARAHPRGAPA